MLKILTLGDVVGRRTLDYLNSTLRAQVTALGADFVVANGENASEIHGITAEDARALLDCGVDLITTGNHVFRAKSLESMLEDAEDIIRPANYPAACPGVGYVIKNINGWRFLCMNVMGVVYLESLASPFETVDRILERERGKYDFSLLDVHAEATSEKYALGRYFDGKINIVFGTHTHVPTADGQILPGGTGYVTDLGMSGPVDGILGTASEAVIKKFLTKMPQRFTVADGRIAVHGVLFTLDTDSRRVVKVERVRF